MFHHLSVEITKKGQQEIEERLSVEPSPYFEKRESRNREK